MKKTIAVILLAAANVAWGQRDVPAVEYKWECCSLHPPEYKCEDTHRILITAEDGKHWCHLPETDDSASRSSVLGNAVPGITYAPEKPYSWPPATHSEPSRDGNSVTLVPDAVDSNAEWGYVVTTEDGAKYLYCSMDKTWKKVAKCELSGGITLEEVMQLIIASEKQKDQLAKKQADLDYKNYIELRDSTLEYMSSSRETIEKKDGVISSQDNYIAHLKRENARLKAELAAAKKGSAKR